MSYISICYSILIRPIELFLELVFSLSLRLVSGYGQAIIILSVIINTLILPLYRRADIIQEKENEKRQLLENWVKHIKNSFKGDERFLVLQTYYRQNDYKPIYVLRGSFSLLLQIPFFIAGYHFLSNLQSLNGISFIFIRDLGAPDRLLNIGDVSINIMPVLMTVINLISAIIYTKGKPFSLKFQLYITALIFLVLLYNSPSGLVLYWLCNNIYSFIKSVFLSHKKTDIIREKSIIKKNNNTSVFILSNVLLTLFVGIFIPANVIKSSPQEFMSAEYYINPNIYIIYAFLPALGTFVIWFGIFYYIANDKYKIILIEIAVFLIISVIINYLFFGVGLGNISALLQYDNGMNFSKKEYFTNAMVMVAAGYLVHYIIKRKPVIIKNGVIGGIITVMIISGINIQQINSYENILYNTDLDNNTDVKIPLSKNGKNVIVLMLDRALGSQLPYIVEEKPELKNMFDGFTYYRNTLSYGRATNFGVPPLYGGYEYTPEMMNKRDDISLEEKHDEALKVMPVIFDEAGYTVTVSDPPYAGYDSPPDLSIFDDYPNIKAFNSMEQFSFTLDNGGDANRIEYIRRRNFFCFSIVKGLPVIFQRLLYDNGMYNEVEKNVSKDKNDIMDIQKSYIQVTDGLSKSEGFDYFSRVPYNVLDNLSNITDIDSGSNNTFLVMNNTFTHEPCLLQEPDYEPSLHVDNTKYDEDLSSRYVIDGVKMHMDDINQVKHYHTNVAALLKVGEWLDYLKDNGVYDNTRIIIVADHGHGINQFDLILDDGLDVQYYLPLLLVKDFNEKGFKTSEEFMTQADVPTMAFKNLIEHPINPFTGNEVNNEEKNADYQKVMSSGLFKVNENNGYKFLPADWYSVKDNVYDLNNWKYLGHY